MGDLLYGYCLAIGALLYQNMFHSVVFTVLCCIIGHYLNSYYENNYYESGIRWKPLLLQVVFTTAVWGSIFFNCEKDTIIIYIAGALISFIVSLILCFIHAKNQGATLVGTFCALLSQILMSIGASLATIIFLFLLILALGGGGSDDDKKKRTKQDKMKRLIIYNEIQDEEDKLF